MTKVQPNKEFEIEFAKTVNEDGTKTDMKWNFILTFKKPLDQLQGGTEGMHKFFMDELGGVDSIKMAGRYAVEITLARTFDPDEVIAAIEQSISTLQSSLTAIN